MNNLVKSNWLKTRIKFVSRFDQYFLLISRDLKSYGKILRILEVICSVFKIQRIKSFWQSSTPLLTKWRRVASKHVKLK